MRPAGRLVTIRRSGDDGAHFPLSLRSCLLGRSIECDIRIQLPVVSKQHCKIEVEDQGVILYNFSSTNPTQVNGSAICEPVRLKHGDVITIIDRSFRYEDEGPQNGRKSPGLTGKRREQEQARRASRSSFSADPDAKGSDPKAQSNVSEGNASRKSLVHVGRLNDSSTWDGLEDSEGHVGHNDRNARESTTGVLKEKSRVAVNCYRERKSCPPVRSLDEGKKSESPFKKLYQSLKDELVTKSQKGEVDIKSQNQSVLPYRRKSVPPPDCARVKEKETQLLLSRKPRPKSGGSAPVKAAASPELEAVQAEDPGGGVPSAQPSEEALSASPLNERAEVKTPVWGSQPLRDDVLHVTHSRESARLDESEGTGVPHEILTPKKLVTRNLTPRKAEDAKPENTSSRKRRRTSAKVEGSPAEIQTQALSARRLAQCDTTEKDALTNPEKLGAATAAQTCSGLPGLISVDVSNFGDSVHKIEGVSLKRRRVSFGGCLQPELFDENLPPNTPLKRGETPTKRRSLVTHTPVLKKTIKPLSSGKKEAPGICLKVTDQETCVGTSVSSPGVTPSRMTHDQRRRSGRASLASGDSKPPLQMDFAKRAARKSSMWPSRRLSVSRSQHDILQMICSKRRSGASEANLIVAKSWADVVKLGTKQTQTKVVKHGPQRQMSKRQRRPSTPKKPTSSVHNQFSTGHANSPCTIVIGKAQIEKVNVPARPYRMLNNFVLNQKLDFSEDLSGLTEMFKTPAKEKQQQRRSRGSTLLSNSENLLGRHCQGTNLGEKPLPVASDVLDANMLSSPLDAAKETSDQYFASPTLRRRSVKDGNTATTARGVCPVTHLEMRTPDSVAEPLKTVAATNRFRRSRQLRDAEMPSVESKSVGTEEDLVEGFTGRRLRKTPLQGQEVKGEAPDSEPSLPRCKENVKSKSPETISAMRRSRNGEPKGESTDLSGSQVVLSMLGCAQEPAHGEEVTKPPSESSQPEAVGSPESRRRRLVAPLWSKDVKEDLFASGRLTQASEESTCTRKSPKSGTPVWKGTTKQKVCSEVDTTAIRPKPRPLEKTQALEDLAGLSELFQTPRHNESRSDDETTAPCGAPEPSTARKKVAMEGDLSAPKQLMHVSRGDSPMLRVPDHEHGRNEAVKESAKPIRDPAASATSSKRHIGEATKAEFLEDLTGFQELFQTPGCGKDAGTVDKTTTMPCISPQQGPGRTPRSTKRLSKISLGEVHVGAELSALGELTLSPVAPAQQGRSTRALLETPECKPKPTGNLTGHKRQPQTPKDWTQSLEDLTGFQELFQTPGVAKDQVATGEIIEMSLKSPEPVRTSGSTTTLPKISLGKAGVKKEFSALREITQSASTATPTVPRQEESGLKASMETPEQELDPSPRRRRRPHTPKRKYQLLEDLAGLQELFQTPGCANDLVTVHETPRMSLKSQPEPSRTPRNTKRLSKKSLGNVDVGEELSAPGQSQSQGKVTHTPMEPVSQTKGTEAIMQTPEQKLEPTGNSSGPKRRPRPPKEKAQPLEDLVGFHELFQTPARASRPVAVDKTPRLSLNALQPDPVQTPASTKRLSKKSLGHVEVGEELLGYRTPPQMSGKTTHARQGPGEHGGLGSSKQPTKQKLDPAAGAPGSKRQRWTPEEQTQALEDLTGLQELFQTPARAQDPATIDETTQLTYRCPRTEPVIAPRSTEKLPRPSFGKVSVEGEVPAFRRQGQSPGKVRPTPTGPVQEQGAEGIAVSPEQKREPTENVTRHERLSRTPKEKSQPLEDITGFQELFQTPGHASDPATVDPTPKKAPQSEPVRTLPHTKRLSKASLGNVEAPVRLPAQNKPLRASEEITLTPRLPEGDGRGSTDPKEPTPPTLDPAVRGTGSKKQRGARKEKAQPAEDLAGFQELFHTPRHGEESVTADKTMEMPVIPKRQPRTSLRKVHETKEPSDFEVLPPPSGKATGTSRVPGEHRGLGSSKQPTKRKLDPAAGAPGSKRLRRAPEEQTQALEDLTGLQELFQTPARAQDPATMAGTSEVREAPEAVETSTWSRRARLRTVDVGGECPVRTERSGTSREARSRRREQKEEPAASVTGRRRPPRALEKVQPPGQQASPKELPQTPDLHEESASHEKTTERPYKYLQPEQRDSPAASKRPLRMRVCKVDMKEEPAAQRKPSGRDTRNAHREPTGNGPSDPEPKQSTKRKLDPAASAPGRKRLRRALKEERQLPEDLAGSSGPIHTPGHTEESLNDDKPIPVAHNSSRPEKVGSPTASPRPRTRRAKADVQEEPGAARKTVRASRRTVRSRQGPEAGDQGIQAPKEAAKLTLDTGASVTGGRRRLRTPKKAAQPPEVPAASREVIQISGHTELLNNDSQSLNTPEQMPDRVRPLRARRRVLRAPKGSPVEVPVDSRAPSASHSNTSQTVTRTSARDGRVSRTRGLRSVAPVQETADEKPICRTQRTAPSERHLSPEPPKMKQLRIVTRRIELAEELISNSLKSKGRKPKEEEVVIPDQKISLRSRRQNTTNTEQQKAEVVVSAEKTELKRNRKKPTKPPQETELQNAGEEAKTSTSRGNVRGRRICLRSGGQREVSQPPAVEEKAPKKSVVIPGKSQNEKGVTRDTDGRSLRSRKTGVQPRGRTLDSEPEPRFTRAARKGAENPKKDKDSECTKKLRTRSHRDS
uniref:proliferation marker protein Ki-67 isoform X2 n=1 Tax=Jaculus jaculus TaxID=51337 RepID=UPI001E1AF9A6|nr:proliferation marker protein Ki-67 isoform X2 [Jaculus jaculus]